MRHEWRSPPTPLVPVARRLLDRLIRLLRAHGDELAGVAVLDPEMAFEPAILAQRHAARARHLVVLPRSLPGEGHAGLDGLAVDVGEQAPIHVPAAELSNADFTEGEIIGTFPPIAAAYHHLGIDT